MVTIEVCRVPATLLVCLLLICRSSYRRDTKNLQVGVVCQRMAIAPRMHFDFGRHRSHAIYSVHSYLLMMLAHRLYVWGYLALFVLIV